MQATVRTVFISAEAESRAGTSAEKKDLANGAQKTQYDHICAECFAKKEGISIEDAHRDIKGETLGEADSEG